jgi:DNA gyrase/topoisomerase IV subunit B
MTVKDNSYYLSKLLSQFEGQTKTKLGNRSCVACKPSCRDMIETYLEENQMAKS